MSIKVAVRVRPFNPREKQLNSELCVDMQGNTTVITELKSGNKRDFTFDYSFWSHDGFVEDDQGYFIAEDQKYADQRRVYDLVGAQILENAWQGYHCCLFAYGQTGAGKSYSMVGYGSNKGIVPIICSEIFQQINQNTDPTKSYEVMFSMLEIYNEKIQDLLIHNKDRPAGGLKVREHKLMGIYVEGLTKHPVDSYFSIERKVDEGNMNRTIAATQMNASSSRAHTIITIEFKQKQQLEKGNTEKLSVINLVDLAGSEKISKTGVTGDRLKEGCSINKSLTVLGQVISALAILSEGKKKGVVVPYRDSALTRILQNALGGNSKTLMICALSPAYDNYEETLSTLRYADQAKKIKNNAVVNESEQDKMIRELKEENDRLKNLLQSLKSENGPNSITDESTLQKLKEMEDMLKTNSMIMADYEKSYNQKLQESKAADQEQVKIDKNQPHLFNLNEDSMLTAKIFYQLDKEIIYVGRKNGNPPPEVVLGGVGIKSNHAIIKNENGIFYLEPYDKECGEFIYVNGEKVYERKQLHQLDRLIFGTNAVFLFCDPSDSEKSELKEPDITWEFAQNELMTRMAAREKEFLDKKILDVEQKFKQEKKQAEDQMKKQLEDYEKKIKELEEKMQNGEEIKLEKQKTQQHFQELVAHYEQERIQQELEIQEEKKELVGEETLKKYKQNENKFFQTKLTQYLPKISEANIIANELGRDIHFSMKMIWFYIENFDLNAVQEDKAKKLKLRIKVENREQNRVYLWDTTKFENRYQLMKELLDEYWDSSEKQTLAQENDPFWDPPEPSLVGEGFLSLMSLAYLLDNPAEITLVGETGAVGSIKVNMIPTDSNGEENLAEESHVESPEELIGKGLAFIMQIDSAKLPETHSTDTYCEYFLLTEKRKIQKFQTRIVEGKNPSPHYGYNQLHRLDIIDEKIIKYLLKHKLSIKIYGYEDTQKSQAQSTKDSSNKMNNNNEHNLKTPPKINYTPQIRQTYSGNLNQTQIPQLGTNNQTPNRLTDFQSTQEQKKDKKNGKKDGDCRMF